jgi:hypothetical protein
LDTLLKEIREGRIYVRKNEEGDLKSYWNKEKRGYCKLKVEAPARTLWRTGFGRGYGPAVRQTTR